MAVMGSFVFTCGSSSMFYIIRFKKEKNKFWESINKTTLNGIPYINLIKLSIKNAVIFAEAFSQSCQPDVQKLIKNYQNIISTLYEV